MKKREVRRAKAPCPLTVQIMNQEDVGSRRIMNGYHGMACRSTEEALDFSELLPPREMQSPLLFCFVECWDRAYTGAD